MKYLYVTTTQYIDMQEWYRFGRYTVNGDQITESVWSDDLVNWNDTATSSAIRPPFDLGHETIQEFFDDPTTLVYKRPSMFRKHHPELLI